ncbi:MAG: M23 family metallopeptidase [Armatimonadota bacterium]
MLESLGVLLIIIIAFVVMLGQGRRVGGCLSKTFSGIFTGIAGCAIVIILMLIIGGMMLGKVNSFFAGIFGGGQKPPTLDQQLTVSMSFDPPSPIAVGNILKIQVTPPARSSVSVQVKDESGNIETLSAKAFQHSYEWKPVKEGNFAVLATAQKGKTVGPTIKQTIFVSPRLSAVTVSTDPATSSSENSQVKIKATSTGGVHVEYAYRIDNHEIRGFEDDPTATVKIDDVGQHTIVAIARDKYSPDIKVEGKTEFTVKAADRFIFPVGEQQISSAGHYKDPKYAKAIGSEVWHTGADQVVPFGTPVYAAAKGEVIRTQGTGENVGLIIKHRLADQVQTSNGPTRDIYVVYGHIIPSVTKGVVEPNQQVGVVLDYQSSIDHLHLGVCVGQNVPMSGWGRAPLVNGQIPTADSFRLTNGWADPVDFLKNHQADNSW